MNVIGDGPRMQHVGSGRRRRSTEFAVWVALLLVFVLATLVVAYQAASHFSGSAIDGPFQLYNAMRRIQAGFRPGVDFQFFHGLGTAYLHYPFYRLFGGGLPGSQLARELLAAVSYPLVFLIAFRAFAGDWRRAIALSAAGMALSFLLKMSAVLFALNGMLGLRAALPTLIPAIAVTVAGRRARAAAIGAALGVSLFLSTEQGLAVLLAYIIVAAVGSLRARDRRAAILDAGATLGIAVAVLVLSLVCVGGVAGMRGALRYNFRLVPMDQYWFFGSPPNTFVPSWAAGAQMLLAVPLIGFAVLFGVTAAAINVARLWRAAEGGAGRRNFALALLSVYGLVSCVSLLGVFTPAYVQPCWRVLLIIALVETTAWSERADARRASARTLLGVPLALAIGVMIVCATAVVRIPLVPTALVHSLPRMLAGPRGPRFTVDSTWAATLRDGQAEIDRHRGPTGQPPSMWSTYAGWIEARNGLFHPSFDYIIHALGPANRAAYVSTFRATQPTLVQTVLPSYTQYEAWIENNDWAFYDELLGQYKVSSVTPWSILWDRRAAPAHEPTLIQSIDLPAGATAVTLAAIPPIAPAQVLLEIDVDYETHNPLRALPVVGGSPRYLVAIRGAFSRTPISLNPYVTTTRFPLVTGAGQQPSLEFATFSLLPGASLRPRRVRVYVREIDDGNRVWFTNLYQRLAHGNADASD